jgi:choline-glycine betaine transporter
VLAGLDAGVERPSELDTALAALLPGGGLGALRAMAVSTGFPFAVVVLLGCYAMVRGFWTEPR